jgi:4-amino-4-deoxy-L-arabinose transferase-like glycosyltransferase
MLFPDNGDNRMSEEKQQSSIQPGLSEEHAPNWLKKYHYHMLMLIMLLAALIGGASIVVIDPESSVGGTDNWWPMVVNVAEGRGFVSCQKQYFPFCETADQTTASREPLPILLFAATATFIPSLVVASIVQLVLFLSTVLGVYMLARTLLNQQIGLIAALLFTLYVPVYRLIPQVSGDLLATMFAVWSMYFVVRGLNTDTWPNWIMAGILFGAGTLSRSVLLFVALVLVGMLIPWRKVFKEFSFSLFGRSALLFIALVLTITPWVVRNYMAFGHVVVGTTLSGYNIYRHNAVILDPDFMRYASPGDAKQAVDRLLANRQDLRGNENEYQMDVVYREEAQNIIAAHPDRYLMLSVYRLLPLWFDIGIDEAYGQKTGTLESLIVIQQTILLVLGILGFWLIGRRSWPLWLPLATVVVMHMTIVARIRFLNIVIPLLLIGGAFVINYTWQWLKLRNKLLTQMLNRAMLG